MPKDNIALKGLAWDHERCWGPLETSVSKYQNEHPDISIVWDRRSLFSFGEGKLEDLVDDYDLIMIDHPFAGESVNNHYFHDLCSLLPQEFLENQKVSSVGPSFDSYLFGTHLTALPIDAACQVAAYRPDIFERHGWQLPRTLDELILLGEKAKSEGLYIGYPAVQVDIICSFLTISANLGFPLEEQKGEFWTLGQFNQVCSVIKKILEYAHPDAYAWNPIHCYEHMSKFDDVVYNPLGFGYLNYSKEGTDKPVMFSNIISFSNGTNTNGSLLGGAGLAITTSCKEPEEAAKYAAFIASEHYQGTDYVLAGGQAGHVAAWDSSANNKLYGGFFSQTRATMEAAYLRPRFPGFMSFFRDAAIKLTTVFTDNAEEEKIWRYLREQYEKSWQKAKDNAHSQQDSQTNGHKVEV